MNLRKLNAKFIEVGVSKKVAAKSLGISVQALGRKLSGKTRTSMDDAEKLCAILNITDYKEKCEIFLGETSQK